MFTYLKDTEHMESGKFECPEKFETFRSRVIIYDFRSHPIHYCPVAVAVGKEYVGHHRQPVHAS